MSQKENKNAKLQKREKALRENMRKRKEKQKESKSKDAKREKSD